MPKGFDIGEILYEDDVKDLKDRDKPRRLSRTMSILALQMGVLLVLYMFIGILGLFVGMVLMFFIFPSPFIAIPNWYKITTKGLYFEKGLVLFTKKWGISFKVRPEKNYVSIYRKNREIMWLYSHDMEQLSKALEKMLQLIEEREAAKEQKKEKGEST